VPKRERITRDPAVWFPLRFAGAPQRLLCLPYAGGSPAMYKRWGQELEDLVEVVPVCLPGRAHRYNEPCIEEMQQLADDIATAADVLLDRPLALFGYSLGALVALEVARRLADRGIPPFLLIAAACSAPCILSPSDESRLLSDDEFVAKLWDLKATPDAILNNLELVQVLMPMLRADFGLAERYRYRPGPRLDTRLVTIAGRADPIAPPESMADWSREAHRFGHLVVDGGHLFIEEDEQRLLTCVRLELIASCGR
jgi:surfactin synthase thioesterase subunit